MKNQTGGKGHKKQKNSKNINNDTGEKRGKKETLYADFNDHQDYAIILKKLGNYHMLLQLPYGSDVKPENKQIIGVVRGSIRKKFIFTTGDVVLFSYRMGLSYDINNKEKVDIFFKYDTKDKKRILQKDTRVEVKNLLKERNIYTKEEEEDSFFFDDDGDDDDDDIIEINSKNIGLQPNRGYDLSDNSSESSDDDIDIENI